jgi:hypothetical protein
MENRFLLLVYAPSTTSYALLGVSSSCGSLSSKAHLRVLESRHADFRRMHRLPFDTSVTFSSLEATVWKHIESGSNNKDPGIDFLPPESRRFIPTLLRILQPHCLPPDICIGSGGGHFLPIHFYYQRLLHFWRLKSQEDSPVISSIIFLLLATGKRLDYLASHRLCIVCTFLDLAAAVLRALKPAAMIRLLHSLCTMCCL